MMKGPFALSVWPQRALHHEEHYIDRVVSMLCYRDTSSSSRGRSLCRPCALPARGRGRWPDPLSSLTSAPVDRILQRLRVSGASWLSRSGQSALAAMSFFFPHRAVLRRAEIWLWGWWCRTQAFSLDLFVSFLIYLCRCLFTPASLQTQTTHSVEHKRWICYISGLLKAYDSWAGSGSRQENKTVYRDINRFFPLSRCITDGVTGGPVVKRGADPRVPVFLHSQL